MPRTNKNRFYVIAHNIRSLFNVGSIFRTADAFGVSKIYLTGYTPTPKLAKHRLKINKVALGAEEFVGWEYKSSAIKLIRDLRLEGIKIIGLENNIKGSISVSSRRAQTLIEVLKYGMALILGEERKGINKKILQLCDKIVEIPIKGKKESLNVSVAFGIAAYEMSKWLN